MNKPASPVVIGLIALIPLTALVVSLVWAPTASASFSERTKRYMSPKDMFSLLTQKFPLMSDPKRVSALHVSCWTVNGGSGNLTGLVSPALGMPATAQPSAGFVRWWGSCVEQIIKEQFHDIATQPTNEKLLARFWAPELLDRLRDKKTPADPFHKLNEMDWGAINDKTKEIQIRYLIEEWIGPNPVIRDLGLVKGADELVTVVKSTLDPSSALKLNEANQKLILALMLREEFFSF